MEWFKCAAENGSDEAKNVLKDLAEGRERTLKVVPDILLGRRAGEVLP